MIHLNVLRKGCLSIISVGILRVSLLLLCGISCSKVSNEEDIDSIISTIKKRSESVELNVNAHNTLLTPLFIAHRGLKAFGPENSIPAFIGAGRMQMWAIETDFRISKDSVVVCMHDATIDATTNGSGKVLDFTYEELLTFRLKKETFDKQYYRYEELSQKELQIPTMDEYLEICQKYRCVPFIELKEDNGIIDKMIDAIKVHGLEGKCIVSSSDMTLLKMARKKGCNERIHHVFSSVKAIDDLLSLGYAGLAFNITDLDSDLSNKHIYKTFNPNTTKDLVDMCHRVGLHVCFRGVNNNDTALKALSLGLDYMPTDYLWDVYF